jgi:hypothetical protein
MFGILGRRRRPNLATLSIDPDDPTIQPPVRVFISHRWATDQALYTSIIQGLYTASPSRIEDLSLTEALRIEGPRGGRVDPLEVKLELASRIRRSDLVFVPATLTAADEDWIQYEIETAAQLGKPVVFVTERPDRERWNRYLALLERHNVPVRTCTTAPDDILWAIRVLLPARSWGRAPDPTA